MRTPERSPSRTKASVRIPVPAPPTATSIPRLARAGVWGWQARVRCTGSAMDCMDDKAGIQHVARTLDNPGIFILITPRIWYRVFPVQTQCAGNLPRNAGLAKQAFATSQTVRQQTLIIRAVCLFLPYDTWSSAWLTSAMMSSIFSIPTDIRTRSGLTPAADNSSAFNCR